MEVELVWKDLAPLRASTGLWLSPARRLAEAPRYDLICVAGGGVNALLSDAEVLGFLRAQGSAARYVTSVCTGALLLGQAGLLAGRRATTHWNARDLLGCFGATPVADRVLPDGNVITAGGVTSGIDFGLAVIAEVLGRDEAETVQLSLEYAPAPPFDAGTAAVARPEILVEARRRLGASRQAREAREALLPQL